MEIILAGYTTLREQNFVAVFLSNEPVPTTQAMSRGASPHDGFFFHTVTLTALSTSLVSRLNAFHACSHLSRNLNPGFMH
jgi:hypothetical protein